MGTSVTHKVLAILGVFGPGATELSLSELARRADLSLATAHRRVAELVEWGALERTSSGRLRVGLRLWEVGSLAERGLRLREHALPFMEDLYVVTRENVQLAVREGHELVFVERIAGRSAVPVLTRVGGRFSLHATGVGLVLLAHAPAHVQDAVLAGELTAYNEHTITDAGRLRSVLAAVRAEGYALSDRMVTTDAMSIAAPVVGPDGACVAALSIVVQAGDDVAVRPLASAVRTAARGVSRAVGMPAELARPPEDSVRTGEDSPFSQ